ncbi:serine acetyltransferase [Candidatus Phycosocius bacilliformis]|uniref:Serine acetyltransferase n=1 Tax=Candidatus Phycosocius bacilliformis TaxID=1445552 RepID=A0A2P2ECL6_9PROT|nr:serine O-acetyltransferase [Candidatus Phycosocius bacilliformis]GBF58806.1 serine acetyltransferase [Candidatus Phycosocius bacilliformis]
MAGISLELVGGIASGLNNVWSHLRIEAATAAAEEPLLASLLNASILNHPSFDDALAYILAQKLGGADMNALQMREVCMQAFRADPGIVRSAQADVRVIKLRDPACRTYLQPFLYYKGFAALQAHRVAHHLWATGREMMAFHLQSRVAELFQVDIHPAARLGEGIFMDHATGIVIGETAVVGDNVSMLHNVTLGGTGKEGGDRHPKIGAGVLIGAGAKILGNIKVGDGARVASGSVVLHEVKPGCTVAGIPARPVGGPCCENPAESMDQVFDVATFDPGL